MSEEIEFPVGIRFDLPKPGTADFVKGRIGINVAEFGPYVKEHKNANGWINFDLLKSKKGNLYLKLNDWTPDKAKMQETKESLSKDEIDPNDIPFSQDQRKSENYASEIKVCSACLKVDVRADHDKECIGQARIEREDNVWK